MRSYDRATFELTEGKKVDRGRRRAGLQCGDIEEVPILGTPSRVSEVLRGKKGLSMAMVQRLRARFRVPADLLLPPLKKAPARRTTKRVAA